MSNSKDLPHAPITDLFYCQSVGIPVKGGARIADIRHTNGELYHNLSLDVVYTIVANARRGSRPEPREKACETALSMFNMPGYPNPPT